MEQIMYWIQVFRHCPIQIKALTEVQVIRTYHRRRLVTNQLHHRHQHSAEQSMMKIILHLLSKSIVVINLSNTFLY